MTLGCLLPHLYKLSTPSSQTSSKQGSLQIPSRTRNTTRLPSGRSCFPNSSSFLRPVFPARGPLAVFACTKNQFVLVILLSISCRIHKGCHRISIKTNQLDGETDWKLRAAVPTCQKLHSNRFIEPRHQNLRHTLPPPFLVPVLNSKVEGCQGVSIITNTHFRLLKISADAGLR